jgi:hypothetical protein
MFWMPDPIFMNIFMYIMAPEPISAAYFINPSHQFVCLYVYPHIVAKQGLKFISRLIARQQLGKHVPAETNTRSNRRVAGSVSVDLSVYPPVVYR